MDFYHLSLKCCEPTSLCALLLLAAAVFRKPKVVGRLCFCLALAILLVCGNHWVSGGFIRRLERQCPAPNPLPQADCILVLGGGTQARLPPRPTVEVDEAGDRVLYGAHLYRQGKAPLVLCTAGTGALRPEAEDMAELLEMLGLPKEAILKETKALNTHQHAENLRSFFREHGFKRILLVTSAMHMPRSIRVFRRGCPGFDFVPAPTDFRAPDPLPQPWYRKLGGFIPTAKNFCDFSEAMHEYIGLAYYHLRGWL
ncbi:MAG: YdcF family protein [Verrucomicrobiota bacterium]|jgi:uncharacterized SAM-binding protein YcdF (DUF218 family)